MKPVQNIFLLMLVFLSIDACIAGEPIELKYRLKTGEEYQLSQILLSESTQKIGGEKTSITTYVSADILFTVIEEQESCFEIEAQYVFLGIVIQSEDGVSSINSDEKGNDASELLGAMKNVPFRLCFNKNGSISNLRGLDDIIKSVFENGPAMTPDDSVTIVNLMNESFGANAISTSIENLTAYMPNKAVKKGEIWKNELSVNSGIKMNYKNTYKLLKVYNDSVMMSRIASVNTPEGGYPKMINKFNVVYTLSGKLMGTMTVDLKTGWIIHSEYVVKLSGNIHFERCPDLPQGFDVPVTMVYNSKALNE